MIVWIFGSSSPFTTALKLWLDRAGHTVITYGRNNVDYTNPTAFLENRSAPDMIIFNQHASGGFLIPFLDYTPSDHIDYALKPMYAQIDSVLLFKTYLVQTFKETKFIFITSSIAILKKHGMQLLVYRMIRALEHQLIYAAAADGINAFGICPGGLTEDNTDEYAAKTAELALSDVCPGAVYFANTGGLVSA